MTKLFGRAVLAAASGLSALPAAACMQLAYVPLPADEVRLGSVAEVFAKPPRVAFSAGGEGILVLPKRHPADRWSVWSKPVDFAMASAADASVDGRPVARVRISYAAFHPREVELLRAGKLGELRETAWKDQDELIVPLRLAYSAKGGKRRDTVGELRVDRGRQVALVPDGGSPLIAVAGPATSGRVSSGRPFAVRLDLPLPAGQRWVLKEAVYGDDEASQPVWHAFSPEQTGAAEFSATGRGRKMRLSFVALDEAGAEAATASVVLDVQPTPKC